MRWHFSYQTHYISLAQLHKWFELQRTSTDQNAIPAASYLFLSHSNLHWKEEYLGHHDMLRILVLELALLCEYDACEVILTQCKRSGQYVNNCFLDLIEVSSSKGKSGRMVESEILSPQQPPQAHTVVPVCNLHRRTRQLSDISRCVLYDNNLISHVASYMITSAQKRFPPVSFIQRLTDGGVIVFERQESDRKWGTSPPAENGAGPSSITVGATSMTDQAQR
ncbi:hypothetical protein Tco_0846687 [Tanacetum coccineum]